MLIKPVVIQKKKVIIIMTIINLLFTSFTDTFTILKIGHYNDINKFYEALNEFKNHKTNTHETQQRKNRVINNTVAFYNNYFDFYKKTFVETYSETLNETFNESNLDERKGYDPYQFKIASLLPDLLKLKNDFNEAKRLID